MAESKTTTIIEDGVAFIEVHDQADVADVAKQLLAAADEPYEVDTATHRGGIGFRVSEKLARKAKFVQVAKKSPAKTDAEKKAEAEAAEKAAAEKKAAEEAAAAKAAEDAKSSNDAGDPAKS